MKLIDIHVYYGKWIYPVDKNGINEYVEWMKKTNVEKTIMVSSLAINYDMQAGNAEIAQIIKDHNNIYGYVYVNANYLQESLKELEYYFKMDKFVGVKFHPEYSRVPFNSYKNERLFELIEKLDKPILVHTWPSAEHGGEAPCSTPELVADVARNRPGLKIIAGHMGGPAWRETVRLVKNLENVWVDQTSSWNDVDKVNYAVRELGKDRVLFGMGMFAGAQIGVVEEANLTKEEKFAFCYENSRKLFKL